MGQIEGLPLGISFIGTAWDDERILRAGFAFERVAPPAPQPKFAASIEATVSQ
jgi:amidase